MTLHNIIKYFYVVFCFFRHLWLLKLQVLAILYRKVDVLQYYVDAFLIGAVKRQESHHTVVINLDTDREIVSLQNKIIKKEIKSDLKLNAKSNKGLYLPDHRWL